MKYPVAVLALLIAAIWWLMRSVRPVVDYSVSGGAVATPEGLITGDELSQTKIERARWSSALRVPIWRGMLSDIDDAAAEAGGPVDWEKRGWPTPCGPADNARQYCKVERLSDFYQQETGNRFPKGTY
jgi:hypothetical protein